MNHATDATPTDSTAANSTAANSIINSVKTIDDMFVRSQINQIAQGVFDTPPKDYSLIGVKFMGKTRVLNFLASPNGPILEHRAAVEIRPMVVFADCEWLGEGEDLLSFLYKEVNHRVSRDLDQREVQEITEHIPEADGNQRLQTLIMGLNRAGVRVVLLLDNFDGILQNADEDPEIERQINQLRPLTRFVSLIVASEHPLHTISRRLASSPLFNLLNQVFLRLIDFKTTQNYLETITDECWDQPQIVQTLTEWTGGHPFLLSRISEILLDVGELLPSHAQIGPDQLPLIRLRLAEDYGSLLFEKMWTDLQALEPPSVAEKTLDLVGQILLDPPSLEAMQQEHPHIFFWLLNNSFVRLADNQVRLFSTLFEEFVRTKLQPGLPQADLSAMREAKETLEEKSQQFTPQERTLLRYFLERPGEVIPVNELLRDVWKRPNPSDRRVQEGIRRLRLRLEEMSAPIGKIENEWGQGYKFVPNRSASQSVNGH